MRLVWPPKMAHNTMVSNLALLARYAIKKTAGKKIKPLKNVFIVLLFISIIYKFH